jgi:hypothetical protein
VGTWGVGVFADDTASDVRDAFRDAIGDGESPRAATARLVEQYAPDDDPDGGPPFWIALAVTQWTLGRLVPSVKKRALRAIKDDSDLARWERSPKDLAKRRAVLARVAAQLSSSPPAAKPVRKRWTESCDWRVGELVIYRTTSGTEVPFRVAGHASDAGGTRPVCEILDLGRPARLDEKTVANAPVVHFSAVRANDEPRSLIWPFSSGPRALPTKRLTQTGIVTKPWHQFRGAGDRRPADGDGPLTAGFTTFDWRYADSLLEHLYGIT